MLKRLGLIIVMLWLWSSIAHAQEDISIETITFETEGYHNIALSPDGNYLATFANSVFFPNFTLDYLPIQLYDLNNLDADPIALTGHTDYARDVIFNSDGSQVISVHANGEINLWNTATGALEKTIVTPLIGMGNDRLVLMPDDQTLYVRNFNNLLLSVLRWDLPTGYMTQTLMQPIETFEIYREEELSNGVPRTLVDFVNAPDGTAIYGVSSYADFWKWDTTTGETTFFNTSVDELPQFNVRRFYITSNGELLLYYHREDEGINLMRTADGTIERLIPIDTAAFSLMRNEVVFGVGSDQLVWLNEAADTLMMSGLDNIEEAVEIPFIAMQPPPAGIEPEPRAHQNIELLQTAGNRIVVGGNGNDDRTINVIYVITLN